MFPSVPRCSFEPVGLAGDLLEVSPQDAQHPLPSLPLVRHQLLKDRDGRRVVPGLLVGDRAQGLGRPRIRRFLGEVPADLEIGIFAWLEASEQLEKEAAAKEERRVALLDGPALDGHGLGPWRRRRGQVLERRGRDASEPSVLGLHVVRLENQVEEPFAEGIHDRGVDQQPFARGPFQAREHGLGMLSGGHFGGEAGDDRHRYCVNVVLALRVSTPDAHEKRGLGAGRHDRPVADAHGLQRLRLGPEPALGSHVARQHGPFELGPDPAPP